VGHFEFQNDPLPEARALDFAENKKFPKQAERLEGFAAENVPINPRI